jgi:hypothetical protein
MNEEMNELRIHVKLLHDKFIYHSKSQLAQRKVLDKKKSKQSKKYELVVHFDI